MPASGGAAGASIAATYTQVALREDAPAREIDEMKKLFAVCAVLSLALSAAAVVAAQEPAGQAAPAAPAAASDVTGTWSGNMQGPNGDMTISFHLKQGDGKLTGTVDSPMGGDPMEIQNGKIDGDKVYWETSFNGMTIQHDGTVSGDEMKIHVKASDGQFPEMDMTLKRAKS
jgi:hypothetical protein